MARRLFTESCRWTGILENVPDELLDFSVFPSDTAHEPGFSMEEEQEGEKGEQKKNDINSVIRMLFFFFYTFFRLFHESTAYKFHSSYLHVHKQVFFSFAVNIYFSLLFIAKRHALLFDFRNWNSLVFALVFSEW